jgi:hypothetical protein
MRIFGTRALAATAALVVSLSCSRSGPADAPYRVGAPPDLVRALEGAPDAGMGRIQWVALRPYERARDLEVLLFASGSPAFAGIVLPGRWVPLLGPWVQPFSAEGLSEVRPDVLQSLGSSGGLLAMPITLDGALLAYRGDLWEELHLPPPNTLAALREAALHLQARRPEFSRPVASDLAADQLFWDLSWSFEGGASPDVYSYPKLHALRFMKEFGLAAEAGGEPDGEQLLLEGRTAALFCTAAEARRLSGQGSPLAGKLRAVRLPGAESAGHCIYAGWCLARPLRSGLAKGGRTGLTGEKYQDYLKACGYLPVLREEKRGDDDISKAMAGTVFHPPPDLGVGGDEVVLGAILDAAQGPVDAEEALRRAEARIHRRAG